jgi:hypothetical protein
MPRVGIAIAALVCCATLAACGGGSGGPSTTASLSPVELKLLLVDHVGHDFIYCDPDLYPVGRGTELGNAKRSRAAMETDPAYPAILDHLGIAPGTKLTDEQLVEAYRLYKKIRFVHITPRLGADHRRYDFQIHLQDRTLTGTISETGDITG